MVLLWQVPELTKLRIWTSDFAGAPLTFEKYFKDGDVRHNVVQGPAGASRCTQNSRLINWAIFVRRWLRKAFTAAQLLCAGRLTHLIRAPWSADSHSRKIVLRTAGPWQNHLNDCPSIQLRRVALAGRRWLRQWRATRGDHPPLTFPDDCFCATGFGSVNFSAGPSSRLSAHADVFVYVHPLGKDASREGNGGGERNDEDAGWGREGRKAGDREGEEETRAKVARARGANARRGEGREGTLGRVKGGARGNQGKEKQDGRERGRGGCKDSGEVDGSERGKC